MKGCYGLKDILTMRMTFLQKPSDLWRTKMEIHRSVDTDDNKSTVLSRRYSSKEFKDVTPFSFPVHNVPLSTPVHVQLYEICISDKTVISVCRYFVRPYTFDVAMLIVPITYKMAVYQRIRYLSLTSDIDVCICASHRPCLRLSTCKPELNQNAHFGES